MKLFSYKAKNQQGRLVKGQVEATGQSQAAELLRRQQLVIITLAPAKQSVFASILKPLQRASTDDVVVMTRQLSTMISAGLPITDALRIIQGQTRPGMAKIIADVLSHVEGGKSLADSISKYKNTFSYVYIALVRAGESAGVLDNILNRLADNLEKQKEFRGKVKGAMIYPTIVVIAMIIVATIMMIFVIPKLTDMYDSFDAELPIVTQILIGVSNFMAKFWYLMGAGLVGLFLLFRSWIATPAGRRKFDKTTLGLPIVGKLQKFVILTEFTRTMALLIKAGIAIIDGLKIGAAAVGNTIYREGILDAAKQVEKGLPLAVPIAQNPHFPPILGQMISVGEETGKLDEVLEKISKYFERESEQGVASLTAAVEPLIMIVLGIGVGILVIAIIMPIYNLTSAL